MFYFSIGLEISLVVCDIVDDGDAADAAALDALHTPFALPEGRIAIQAKVSHSECVCV